MHVIEDGDLIFLSEESEEKLTWRSSVDKLAASNISPMYILVVLLAAEIEEPDLVSMLFTIFCKRKKCWTFSQTILNIPGHYFISKASYEKVRKTHAYS